jgi:hypothetical protein
MDATVHDERLPLFYSFLSIQTVSRTPWAGDQPAAWPLSTQDNTNTEQTQNSGHRMGFNPMTPVFERAKTVHALDRATTEIDIQLRVYKQKIKLRLEFSYILTFSL